MGNKTNNASNKGRKCITNFKESIYVFPNELQDYLDQGWVLGSHKMKGNKSTLGTHIINDGENEKFVPKEELNDYLELGCGLKEI